MGSSEAIANTHKDKYRYLFCQAVLHGGTVTL